MTRNAWRRRDFLMTGGTAALAALARPLRGAAGEAGTVPRNKIFNVRFIPDDPFYDPARPNLHAGVDALLGLLAANGLPFYRSNETSDWTGPAGLIARDDVVLVKVNAQWKYRGCTNSDLVRGVVQRVLDHPDGFRGEVVIVENGQGRASLNCDTRYYYPDAEVHANANDERHSFRYLVDRIFKGRRVGCYLLDDIRQNFIGGSDHTKAGYRKLGDVSYPCFTTPGGRRVELARGIWTGAGFGRNLKLINIPVLKHHDEGGSEITAGLKHFYGLLSMSDGMSGFRHYEGLGKTCGAMVASVRTPVLNIIDAIWVSHRNIKGHPESKPFRANRIAASQDPVALDYWAAKYILYPVDQNGRHHPSFPGIDAWLRDARDTINAAGGLYDPEQGIQVRRVTKDERRMQVFSASAALVQGSGRG
jgi:hypothetical protein